MLYISQANNEEKSAESREGVAVRLYEGTKVNRKGFPRIIKAGHGIKQGAVVCRCIKKLGMI